ncbi:MAG: hypothetical protein COB67_09480 [SAR324 cluster bacterium]|uniref:Uncharacterized protein n=1 Tax=SAR324 cluster bacterium TaxID=2024889 RepID=A0A2A4T0Z7_9DELT|nr:MAG: hypothetical protein COB67_09480 [SAR324 cluster bacterium]
MGKRSRDYHEILIEDLKEPAEAAAYLEVALEEGSNEEFLLALRNVAELSILVLMPHATTLDCGLLGTMKS